MDFARFSEDNTYVARLSKDTSGITYTQKIWKNNSTYEEIEVNSYISVKIYKIIEPKFEQLIHEYKESTIGPSTNAILKCFVKVNGVQWFIGALNFKQRYYVNCETGKSYIDNEDMYNTFYRIESISPNGIYIIVNTYTYAGNSESNQIYDISNLDKNGAVLKNFVKDPPSIFRLEDTDLIRMEFTGNTENEVRIQYKKDYEEDEFYEMGIYYIN
jgi:hypothetical protein